MLRALQHIANRQQSFSALPFFAYLRDSGVSAEVRFRFVPAVAPFVMAFSDLNKFSLCVPHPTAPIEALISRHGEEDATHYQMYLQDLEILGFNEPRKFTSTLRFLWSDERSRSRQTCYSLTALLAAASQTLRLVIVEAIEAAGAAAFQILGELAADYHAATGKELQFFGRRHKELETGHTMGTEHIEQQLHALVLSEDELGAMSAIVDEVFAIFAAMMAELHQYGLEHAS